MAIHMQVHFCDGKEIFFVAYCHIAVVQCICDVSFWRVFLCFHVN